MEDNMKKFIFINESVTSNYSFFKLLLDPSDVSLVAVSVDGYRENKKAVAMRIVEGVYQDDWYQKDLYVTSDEKYFVFFSTVVYEVIEIIDFPDDESGKLWFLLEHGT
jgi:hypothetical protein